MRRLRPNAKLPYRATATASGFDLYACLDAPVKLGQMPTVVGTGIAIETPAGLDVQVRPRSGLARQGILATFGTVDSDYRGELLVSLYTLSPEIEYTVQDGDRIAQIVIARLADVAFEETVEELSETSRGSGGHGSTGR